MGEYKNVPQEINDVVSDNIKKLAQLFPSAVKDGQLDIDALKEELGTFEEVGKEKYEFTWSGKQNAKKIAQQDVFGKTLKFCPEKSKNADTTENIYIEGDNLEALKLLRQNYYNSIKMIYIDPPYNTGNDFVYNDDYSMSQEESDIAEGVVDELGERYTKNVSGNRFHANWCNMIYPRLKLAKDLLTDDGVIFISIDDNEQENLLEICCEIFGESNYCGTIPYRKRTMKTDVPFGVSQDYEWVVVFAKSDAFFAGVPVERKYYKTNDYPNDRWRLSDLTTQKIESQRPNSAFNLIDPKTRKEYKYNPKRLWAITKDTFSDYYKRGKIVFPDDYEFLKISIPAYRVFESEDRAKALKMYGTEQPLKSFSTVLSSDVGMNEQGSKEVDNVLGNKIFTFPKPSSLVYQFLLSIHDKNAIILDFFSGSATTAHAVMQLNAEDGGNRKFIMVQLEEKTDEKSEAHKAGYNTICEIGEERIRRAGDKIKAEHPDADIDIGFKVFEIADTNIKWNELELKDEQIDFANLSNNPDQVDFKQGTKDIDVVYEIMLRQKNIPLSSKIEVLDEIGSRTYIYADSYLVCLETQVTNDMIDKLASLDPTPFKYIFRDSAFKDDIDLKTNAFRRLKAMVEKHAGATKKAYTVEFI